MAAAFAKAERVGLRLYGWVRLATLAAVAAWLVVSYPWDRALPGVAVVAVFAVLGVVAGLVGRYFGRDIFWAGVFATLDVALLVAVILLPHPLAGSAWPPQMRLRFSGSLYLFLYVAGLALSSSPSLVIWAGAVAVLAWGVGHLLILDLPDSIATHGLRLVDEPGLAASGALELYLDPHYVSIAAWETQTVLLILLVAVLAVAVTRWRALLRRQVADAIARTNLSRYFSPNVVEELASSADVGRRAQRQPVAVLFADIQNFTGFAERLSPEAALALLRSFHGRMAAVVFSHGGTLDKYIGDALMATFGTPHPARDDAARALASGFAMLGEIERWNAKRRSRGALPIRIGIGVHWGEAVVGDVGHARRLEYTVIGDVVNVASRLERLSRELQADLVTSAATVERAAEAADAGLRQCLAGLTSTGETLVKGRAEAVAVRAFRRGAA